MNPKMEASLFHYARMILRDEMDEPELWCFVALDGTDDWVGVKPEWSPGPDDEQEVKRIVEDHFRPTRRTDPMRIDRSFLEARGAEIVELGK